MYVKLILRNARRSVRDYLIYMVTLTVCVTLFYSFLSISSASYDPKLDVSYDITMLSDGMKLAICLVTFLILFLIRYVNRFMLQRRQKEFTVQSVMGMAQRTIGRLFFAETLIMGMASVAAGILLGMVCSQFITAMLLADFGQPYRFTWMLYPDTVLLTVAVFLASFLAVGFWNARTIRKLPLIEMLYAERQNEAKVSDSKFMPVLTVLYLLALLWTLESGIVIRHFYFDPRYPFPVHILFGGNILFPALAILLASAWGIAAVIRRRRKFLSFHALMKTEMVLALFCGIWAAGVPMLRNAYWLPYDANVMNQYLLFLALHLFYVICGLLFLSAEAVSAWKDRSPEHRYRGENLFFLGQIISRLRSGAKTMTVVCGTMILSVCLFLAVPVLSGWAYGYLDERSVFDVQMNSFITM